MQNNRYTNLMCLLNTPTKTFQTIYLKYKFHPKEVNIYLLFLNLVSYVNFYIEFQLLKIQLMHAWQLSYVTSGNLWHSEKLQ